MFLLSFCKLLHTIENIYYRFINKNNRRYLQISYSKNITMIPNLKQLKCNERHDITSKRGIKVFFFNGSFNIFLSQIFCFFSELFFNDSILYLLFYRYIVERGGKIDLHSNNNQGPRPIHWASRNGHVAVVDLLLESGVPVDATDHKVIINLLVALICTVYLI